MSLLNPLTKFSFFFYKYDILYIYGPIILSADVYNFALVTKHILIFLPKCLYLPFGCFIIMCSIAILI